MLAGLAAGATMILADDDEHRDPEALGELMTRYSVAQVTAVPSLVSALVDSRPDAVRAVAAGVRWRAGQHVAAATAGVGVRRRRCDRVAEQHRFH